MPDSLATADDLQARLGRDLTPDEEARATALLADASARVRAYAGQDFAPSAETTIVLRAAGGRIRLPQRPVTAVTTVKAVAGLPGLSDLPMLDWSWDGINEVILGTNALIINLPEGWWDEDDYAYPGTYRVTYTAGYDEVPADVVAVVCGMVLRTLTAPTMMGGVTGETIGSYSYRLDGGAGVGLAVALSADDRRALDRYRQTAGSIPLRLR